MNIPKALLSLILLIASSSVWATAQIPDEIEVDGQSAVLHTEPLVPLIQSPGFQAKLEKVLPERSCTASWRGYQARWVIANDVLSLKAIVLDPCSALSASNKGKPISYLPLKDIFPDASGPVAATWYSGVLTIPQGKMLEYVHMGYASRYERYLRITVEKGKVIKRETQAN